ncbi:SAM-dependent methyltransferase [Cryobacterium sp. LW097]|uniref:class I SAM-dependent methyltransferase n=1 Tax=Cryobacterium sp. LW097 TaxID=1978566 RepID=UPI000B4CADB7|nr:class I SAM-dependent methyltransferase [Cryobacterium sp. LW097]ASD22495.1 SAM-dependent methyltransferase [Cryobacterium sp. LW097]
MAQLTSPVLQALGRFNDRHPWSHNDAYSGWIVYQARRVHFRGGSRALDVGCGTGHLVERLSRELSDVRGIEPDPASVEAARYNTRELRNVVISRSTWAEVRDTPYDLITFVAVLHHLPLQETLRRASLLVAPGGRLVIVGVARETARDIPLSLISTLLNPLVGLALHPRPAVRLPAHMRSPIQPPTETYAEVKAVARRVLPGITLRRSLFWRYTAVWTAPPSSSQVRRPVFRSRLRRATG